MIVWKAILSNMPLECFAGPLIHPLSEINGHLYIERISATINNFTSQKSETQCFCLGVFFCSFVSKPGSYLEFN